MNRSGPERVFLGWDKPLLTESVNWLLQKYPSDLENLIIANDWIQINFDDE